MNANALLFRRPWENAAALNAILSAGADIGTMAGGYCVGVPASRQRIVVQEYQYYIGTPGLRPCIGPPRRSSN